MSGYLELLSKSGWDDGHGEGGILWGSQCSKLEFVGGVSIGTGSVSISVFLIDIFLQVEYFFSKVEFCWRFLILENGRDGLSQVGGDDSWRSLVAS